MEIMVFLILPIAINFHDLGIVFSLIRHIRICRILSYQCVPDVACALYFLSSQCVCVVARFHVPAA